ncbi:MmgE/PrpD family protein [Ruegeria sp. HKCCD4315]|nr:MULTISPECIES: MmgE/PrpD family protein [unclassified Ruegeria]NOD77864.1 MmgE/PrpD family protein [Ruegeria sp. HKCCD4332]NOD88095.1 MmgE/PrpD family protein [Ruegeria sp. HKCCD4318]NOE14943.1 MmgE/PrpD family protein [Ruegeria sp. HKCCD4318-2]NOG11454.1 MmgE/PrpD family protein [Ruegeria sp. HKCCD4315]
MRAETGIQTSNASRQPVADRFHKIACFTLETTAGDIPESTLSAAARMTLDTLGITIGSGPMTAGVIARESALALYGAGDETFSARMMFDGRRVSAAGAAYAAATQTDNLDGHDGYNPTKGHIGVAVVPALAAVAETIGDISGPEALSAVTIGYEVAGRAGISLHNTVSDYHTSGAWNALGVVAVAARLRGMNQDQMRQAMGIAEYHGPRSQMMREIANPTMLHDGSGWGALVGLSSTLLAEKGFTGAPAITVEADEVAPYWQDLGQFWQMEHQYVKPYPICRWAHAAIDATRALMRDHDITHKDIASIRVNTFRESACLFQGMPDDTSKAQYSLPFAVATMAAYGRIGVEHITGSGLSDPLVASIVDRVSVFETERHSARFPKSRIADVSITLKDGRILDSGDVHARGGPEAPMNDAEVDEKFMEFAAPSLGDTRAAAIRDAVWGLCQPGSRFSDLSALLYDAPKA